MTRDPRNRTIAILIFCLISTGCSRIQEGRHQGTAASAAEDRGAGFTPLSLADFDVFQGKTRPKTPTWTAEGSILRCTGSPRGYLYSKKPHRNFTLKADLRYPADLAGGESKANTGFFAAIQQPHRVWPVCIEIQGKYVEMAAIKGNGKPNPLDPAKVHDDDPARLRTRRPLGEWNSIEIIAHEGRFTSLLNGNRISESEPLELSAGPIGLQAEGCPYEIRNLRIRDDSPQSP